MTAATVRDQPNQRHAHKPNGAESDTERCPWCGSEITRAEFRRIRDQIAEQERARVAKAEQSLRQQFTRAQDEAATKATAEIEKVKHHALVEVAKIRKQAQLDRNAIEKQAKEAALLTLPTKVA